MSILSESTRPVQQFSSSTRLMPHELLVQGNHSMCPRNISASHLELLKFIGKMLAVSVSHKEVINFRLAHPLVKMVSVW